MFKHPLLYIALLFITHSSYALESKPIKVQPLAEGIYMLSGVGGNIGLSVGRDGVLMIDDQYASQVDEIKRAIGGLSEFSPTFVINTHYHGDHTGSNHFFGTVSHIVAHDQVRIRLLEEGKAKEALPSIVYRDQMGFFFNDQEMKLVYQGPGHTDGDTVVYWTKANVVHAGDLFFHDRFPYIDLQGGGSVEGYRSAVSRILEQIDSATLIIPGHGALATKADYQRFYDMIDASIKWMKKLKSESKTRDEIQAVGVPSDFKSWGWHFITEERWINTLYDGL